MKKDDLKRVVQDQSDVFRTKKGLIARDVNYKKYIETSQVVVITGVRRCGKSSLMHLFMQEMQLKISDYCYFNFDDERIIPYPSILEDIDNIHRERYGNDAILFFDEIQNIDGWEKFVNRQYEQGRKIFVTGSNGTLLSSEISSSLTGRNKVLELLPFSFSEYLRFKEQSFDIDRLTRSVESLILRQFNDFFKVGGFPLVVKENDLEILDAYFKDILYRDMISRNNIIQINEIKQIALYFFSNTSKLFSLSTLQKITGIKSSSSVKKYLDYYNSSYLFFYLKKFDYSVKKQILNPRKVYSVDQGFSNRIGFNFSENKGRILENIVYLELVRRKKDVYYYSNRGECDFVVQKGISIIEAFQVVYSLNHNNIEREVLGLTEAMHNFNLKDGTIIVYNVDTDTSTIPSNINIVPIWMFLLKRHSLT